MAAATAALVIKMTSDEADAVKGAQAVTRAAADMGDQVERSSRQVADSSRSMTSAADTADELAGKTGKATGALGALAGGLEAVGLEKYALGLQGAAIATDFASGASDAFNLVMESKVVTTLRDKAATVAHTVATKAQRVALIATTVAQRALNVAMRANPIGLLITAVTVVIGLLVLAYKRSETFRNIVNGVFTAVGKVASTVAGAIRKGWETLTNKLGDFFTGARDKIRTAFDNMRDKAVAVASAITAPFRAIVDLIDSIIDKIKDIDLPDLPDLNPFSRSVSTAGSSFGTTSTQDTWGVQPVQVTVEFRGGFVGDEAQLARVVTQAIQRATTRTGRQAVFG